jgi:hypothetical protein
MPQRSDSYGTVKTLAYALFIATVPIGAVALAEPFAEECSGLH